METLQQNSFIKAWYYKKTPQIIWKYYGKMLADFIIKLYQDGIKWNVFKMLLNETSDILSQVSPSALAFNSFGI